MGGNVGAGLLRISYCFSCGSHHNYESKTWQGAIVSCTFFSFRWIIDWHRDPGRDVFFPFWRLGPDDGTQAQKFLQQNHAGQPCLQKAIPAYLCGTLFTPCPAPYRRSLTP
jgi:hypothetical protein